MHATVEPRFDEVPRDWQNVFTITRFSYIKVLFHIFYHYWGKENRSFFRGLRYIEVCYIEVPLQKSLMTLIFSGLEIVVNKVGKFCLVVLCRFLPRFFVVVVFFVANFWFELCKIICKVKFVFPLFN